jgi:hypothetical protein
LNDLKHIAYIVGKNPVILKEWNLKVNERKLELTTLERCEKKGAMQEIFHARW